MKIIYCCYGGTHSSPIAAAIHLGTLPRDRVPSPEELMAAALFDKVTRRDRGKVFFAGRDRWGHDVFVLGRGKEPMGIPNAVKSGLELAGRQVDDVRFVDTLQCVNVWMRIGGFLSRALGWVGAGRPIVVYGTRQAYPQLKRLVERVERELAGQARADGPGPATPPAK